LLTSFILSGDDQQNVIACVYTTSLKTQLLRTCFYLPPFTYLGSLSLSISANSSALMTTTLYRNPGLGRNGSLVSMLKTFSPTLTLRVNMLECFSRAKFIYHGSMAQPYTQTEPHSMGRVLALIIMKKKLARTNTCA
jgi:hypothetical protein